ncbi:serum paraoxonase/arylesterase 2 [Chanos chanos]|uniref:Paraoxonase n=1 Tax=Chanos chanos TaxID=29144 RepID=A0A6J2W2V5_CHACN|nr:serum paraoxonase/arylesterase 2-like [Chanos chanos]
MGKALITIIVAAIAIFVGERAINFRHSMLATRELTRKDLPNCRPLQGIDYGAEDITILKDGLAFISTGLKYPGAPSYSDDPGKIYTVDLLDPDLNPVELRIDGEFDRSSFNPHGISVYTDKKDGSIYLFVVNHPEYKSQIEIFKFHEQENAIVHKKTIKHDLLHSVNDIVAVGTESFYATNDHYFSNDMLKHAELLLTLPWCNVVHYSPEEVKVVAKGFHFANGINISPDKRHIYVSDFFNHKIVVMEIGESSTLTHVKEVGVGCLPDNIEVDYETGDLWLGCQPNGAKLFASDPKDPPGSEVIRIQNIHSEKPAVTQVYADDGRVIIGSSVAAPYGGKLLIGSVYHKALCCDQK